MSGFGRRLAWLRKRAGMTQAQFAERIGTNIAMISLYEHEKTAPSVPRLQTMADVFGMVAKKDVAALMIQAWERKKMGEVILSRTLYSHHHGDLQELADYLIGQTRAFRNKSRYHPSRAASRPEHEPPRVSINGFADLRLPKGCVKIWRSEFQAGRPQSLRYWRPPERGGPPE